MSYDEMDRAHSLDTAYENHLRDLRNALRALLDDERLRGRDRQALEELKRWAQAEMDHIVARWN